GAEHAAAVAVALEHAEDERDLAALDGVVLDRHAEIPETGADPLVRGRGLADDAADPHHLREQPLAAADVDADRCLLIGAHVLVLSGSGAAGSRSIDGCSRRLRPPSTGIRAP